jgi:hypothetical protein
MKKSLFLTLVTLFVTTLGFSQIKVDENKNNPYRMHSGASGSGFEYYLPFMEYYGFEMNPYYSRPKGFQGILILRSENDKPPWLKYDETKDKKPVTKPDSTKVIQKPIL